MSEDDLDDFPTESSRPAARPGALVDPARLQLSVKRGWRWIPISAAICGALGALVAFLFVTHTYASQAVLVWEPRTEGGMRTDERFLATEAGSINLPGSVRKIRERLKLGVPVDTLQQHIEVNFNTQTNLVTVDGKGPTARDAAVLTNTVIAVFLERQAEIVRARAEDTRRALQLDIEAENRKLAQARAEFDAFLSDKGVSNIDQETTAAIAEVAKQKAEEQQTAVDIQALKGTIAALQEQRKRTPQLNAVPENSSINRTQEELAKARAIHPADHPKVLRLAEELRQLEANPITTGGANPQYDAIAARLSTEQSNLRSAEEKLSGYKSAIANAEARVQTLRPLQGPGRSLFAAIELSERRLGDLSNRLAQANNEVRTPHVEWRVLTPAVEPEWPERSARRVIILGMPLLGVLIALLGLLLRPLRDGKVYTAREAGYWAHCPVVGASTWPQTPDAVAALAEDLSHDSMVAPGYTLVVGATGRERPFAEELARWLGGGAIEHTAEHPAARERVTVPPAPSQHDLDDAGDVAVVTAPQTALVSLRDRASLAPVALIPQGTHAWLGTMEGPALRRAARIADRVVVLLTSGAETFSDVAALRTRLGRDTGIAIVMIGLSSELMKLPDRCGDVNGFWTKRRG